MDRPLQVRGGHGGPSRATVRSTEGPVFANRSKTQNIYVRESDLPVRREDAWQEVPAMGRSPDGLGVRLDQIDAIARRWLEDLNNQQVQPSRRRRRFRFPQLPDGVRTYGSAVAASASLPWKASKGKGLAARGGAAVATIFTTIFSPLLAIPLTLMLLDEESEA